MTDKKPPVDGEGPGRYADCGYVGLTREPQHKCDKCKPLMLVSEHEELLRQERAKAFEEAAEFCQSPDITDERTVCVLAVIRAVLKDKAAAARAENGGSDDR